MQYARVIIDRKMTASKPLTYGIPAALLADISVGQIVDVPLRGATVKGIITDLIKRIPEDIKPLPIKKIRSTGRVLTTIHLDLYKKIAAHTLSSLEDVTFYFLPPFTRLVDNSLPNIKLPNKKGTIRLVQYPLAKRFSSYLGLIDKYSNKASVLFIFPDLTTLNGFASILKKPHTIISSEETPAKRWKKWFTVHDKKSIILATRQGIGLIPPAPVITIIDQPDHPGFKEDRRPKYTVEELIRFRIELGDHVIVGTSFPTTTLSYLYNLLPKNILPPINLNTSPTVIDQIVTKIPDGNSVIVVPQKGEYGLIICKECNQILRCQTCNSPLLESKKGVLNCKKCQTVLQGYPPCANCQGLNYRGYSIGTRSIEKALRETFPNRIIVRIDTDSPIVTPEVITSATNTIFIGTHKLLDYPLANIAYTYCIGFDPLLDIPQSNQEEVILKILVNFAILGAKTEIFTKRPEHRVYHALASNTAKELLVELFRERPTTEPPYSRMVLVSSKKDFTNVLIDILNTYSTSKFEITKNTTEHSAIVYIDRSKWTEFYNQVVSSKINVVMNPDPR